MNFSDRLVLLEQAQKVWKERRAKHLCPVAKDTLKEDAERSTYQQLEQERLRSLNQAEATLVEIQRTITLINSGKWDGSCKKCDGPILDKRIKEVPWATRCTPCEDQLTIRAFLRPEVEHRMGRIGNR